MLKVILNYVIVTHFHLRCLNAGETFVENMSPDNRFTTIKFLMSSTTHQMWYIFSVKDQTCYHSQVGGEL